MPVWMYERHDTISHVEQNMVMLSEVKSSVLHKTDFNLTHHSDVNLETKEFCSHLAVQTDPHCSCLVRLSCKCH